MVPDEIVSVISERKNARYIRLNRRDARGRETIYAFLCPVTGDLFKAASANVPAKGARGNIYAPDMLAGCGPYGMEYKRGGSFTFSGMDSLKTVK